VLEREKLADVHQKGYIRYKPGLRSPTSFFLVPKVWAAGAAPSDKGQGYDSSKVLDVRMVYDGTKSGLNEVLYTPWFKLPNVSTMV
jgi:hypothetical protein